MNVFSKWALHRLAPALEISRSESSELSRLVHTGCNCRNPGSNTTSENPHQQNVEAFDDGVFHQQVHLAAAEERKWHRALGATATGTAAARGRPSETASSTGETRVKLMGCTGRAGMACDLATGAGGGGTGEAQVNALGRELVSWSEFPQVAQACHCRSVVYADSTLGIDKANRVV